jgi:hypothetical protein
MIDRCRVTRRLQSRCPLTEGNQPSRLLALDALRAVAVLLVLGRHFLNIEAVLNAEHAVFKLEHLLGVRRQILGDFGSRSGICGFVICDVDQIRFVGVVVLLQISVELRREFRLDLLVASQRLEQHAGKIGFVHDFGPGGQGGADVLLQGPNEVFISFTGHDGQHDSHRGRCSGDPSDCRSG